jgi:heme/copper-type cytochrome/quinol oxidase subunit 2
MRTAIFSLLALLPSYSSLFLSSGGAAIVMVMGTICVAFFGAHVSDEAKHLKDTARLVILLHVIGIFIVIGFHNL